MSRNQWWGVWRKSFGLTWGEEEDSTLTKFATRAVCTATPALLGSLLLCFALSTGNYNQYITSVERWMQTDNFRLTHKYDFQCLMGLGLCLLSALQPLRAWTVYRKANSLLQLKGIHRSRRRSKSLDLIFWQLFSADRWVSLLTGLPYSVPDHLCYLAITPITQSDPVTYHHRHMTVLTGRIIECLQSPMDFLFTAVVRVDEEIDNITAQLPANYLSMPHIAACPDVDERYARLYRVTEVFQLKTFLYLPLFLQHCGTEKQKLGQLQSALYGRTACLNSARSLIEAYLVLYDTNPATATMDNSMKLTSFTALTAAVVLFLNLLTGDHSPSGHIADSSGSSTMQVDTALINRAAAVFEACSEGQSRSLCGQCHTALADLISCSQTLSRGESRNISVPFFGTVEVIRKETTASTHSPAARIPVNNENIHTVSTTLSPSILDFAPDESHDIVLPASTIGDDIFFTYHGPWESHQQEPCWPGEFLEANVSSSNISLDQDYISGFPL
jgi:hypothetical protein